MKNIIKLLFTMQLISNAQAAVVDYINLPVNGYIGTASTITQIGDIPINQTGKITNFYGFTPGSAADAGTFPYLWSGDFFANLAANTSLSLVVTEPSNFNNADVTFVTSLLGYNNTASATAQIDWKLNSDASIIPNSQFSTINTNTNALYANESVSVSVAADFSSVSFTATNYSTASEKLSFSLGQGLINTVSESSNFAPVVNYAVSAYTPVAAVPLPAAAWLLGSSLLSWLWIPRKRHS